MRCPEFTAVVKPSDSSHLWALEKEREVGGLLKITASHQTSITEHSGSHICHKSQLHTCQSKETLLLQVKLSVAYRGWGGGVLGGQEQTCSAL